MDLEGQPAQRGWELCGNGEVGGLGGLHSQEKSPRCSTARAANGAMEPGLRLGSPSVRNGSGESYPDPSETNKKKTSDKKRHDLRIAKGKADKDETV